MTNCPDRNGGCNCGDLLYAVQMYGFVLYEAQLFLDTHPNDTTALEYYRKYSQLYREAVEAYESACGPLSSKSDYAVGNTWRWIDGGWPWHNGNDYYEQGNGQNGMQNGMQNGVQNGTQNNMQNNMQNNTRNGTNRGAQNNGREGGNR